MAFRISKEMQAAEAELNKQSQDLTGMDFDSNQVVFIDTEEGSQFRFRSAFYRIWTDSSGYKWLFLFAEHYYPQCFALQDVLSYYSAKLNYGENSNI